MTIWDPPAEIGILLYPDVASATVHGLTDLFTVATRLHVNVWAQRTGLRVSHWLPNSANDAVERVFDSHPNLASSRHVAVIVPGSWQGEPAPDVTRCLVRWLMDRHAAGSTMCSVCGGAFVLAELDCSRAAPPRLDLSMLAQRFPIFMDEQRIALKRVRAGGVLRGRLEL